VGTTSEAETPPVAADGGAVADRILKVDHVAIALPDMAAAVPLFRDALGGRFIAGGDNDDTGIRLVHLMLPGFKLELMQPLRDDSLISGPLERRGAGFHHMTFLVDDVPATVDALEGEGFQVTGTSLASRHWRETFLSPRDPFGALLQFVDTTRDWEVPVRDFELEDVLAGRVVWRDYVPCLRRTAPGGDDR
jgi:methylmalonyl-CoA/ethylmalonyl-CoA epimerase